MIFVIMRRHWKEYIQNSGVLTMKNIMFVCLGLNNGGVARVISVLTEAFDKSKYKLFVLSLSKDEETYKVSPDTTLIYPSKNSLKPGLKQINRIMEIKNVIKKYDIDVVLSFSHYNNMYSVLASRGLKCKVIGSERNDPAQLDSRKLFNRIRMKLYRKLDALVCQTDDAKAYFPEDIQKKSVVILNPITDKLPEVYRGERKHRVVSFSRLEPQKNIPMLLEAFSIFHDTHTDYILDIYGNGSQREELIDTVKARGWDGFINFQSYTTDIHNAIRDAYMFALSSDYEGLSNSMIEAMGCGLPTIVTDCPCGGARMVIEDGVNGILVPVGDVEALAREMSRVADDKALAEKLISNGVKIRKTLDKRVIASQWEKVINQNL